MYNGQSQNWKDGDNVTIKVKRNGKEQTLTGKAILSYQESEGYQVVEPAKQTLKEAWLKAVSYTHLDVYKRQV